MKNIIFALLVCFSILSVSCKNDSSVVTNENNPPADSSWVLDYHDYNIGTLFCTWPNPCMIDVVTDTIDVTNKDSIRIIISFHSFVNNSLTITKIPYPQEIYNCQFGDSTYGKLDKVFPSFRTKILIDFGFDVGTKFTIDTLQIFKKL